MRRPVIATRPAEFLREMVAESVGNLEAARSRLARAESSYFASEGEERAAWSDIRRQLEGEAHSLEASLAYLLDEAFDALSPDGPREEAEFRPFGIVVGGVAYVVRFDPGDMSPGVIGRVELEMLLDLC